MPTPKARIARWPLAEVTRASSWALFIALNHSPAFDHDVRQYRTYGDDDDGDDAKRRAWSAARRGLHENIKTVGKRCIRIRLHKHKRRRQFDRSGRETRHKARKDAACHQRQYDAPHGPRFGGAEIFRRFL